MGKGIKSIENEVIENDLKNKKQGIAKMQDQKLDPMSTMNHVGQKIKKTSNDQNSKKTSQPKH